MSRYDLRTCRALPWVSYLRWFRVCFSVFIAAVSTWVAYGLYVEASDGMLSTLRFFGVALIFLILGLFTFVVAAMRAPAIDLTIDALGFRLEFERGSPDIRLWNESRTRFLGRFTDGASDTISQGRPVWSVYGRFGALSESFIPKSAFDELVSVSKSHGFVLSERRDRPGWTLYTIGRR